MSHNLIGFLGCDLYDVILYCGSILQQLEYKVLLVDESESCALTCCISAPEEYRRYLFESAWGKKNQEILQLTCDTCHETSEYHTALMVNGQETDRKSKLVLTYQGMDFIRGINPEELKELSKSYDYIFISMGYEENKELLDLCKNIFLCTDQQLQHILQLRYVDCIDQSKSYLLFSSSEDKRIDANYIQALSEITFDKDHICEFICDEKDQLLKLNCQY